MDKREIKRLKSGVYTLPTYRLEEGLVKTDNTVLLKFMETSSDFTSTVKQEGLLTETVLESALQHLLELNDITPNRYMLRAINNIEEAIWALQEKERLETN